MMRPIAAGVGAVLVLLLGAGCTGDWLLRDDRPTTEGSPVPTESSTPGAQPEEDCEVLVLDESGDYDLGECETLTIEGDDIAVGAESIGELIIRGDGNEVVVTGGIDHVVVVGDDNVVDAGGPIGTVTESGRDNRID